MASFLTIIIILFWQYALEWFSEKPQKPDNGDDGDNKPVLTETHREQPAASSSKTTPNDDNDDDAEDEDTYEMCGASTDGGNNSILHPAEEKELAFEQEIVDLQSSLCSTKEELDKERNAHINTERELLEKTSECDELRKHWKNATATTTHLTHTRHDSQGFPQITDDVLIQATQRLRFRIQNFAIQYFGDEDTFNSRLEINEVQPFDKYTWSSKSWKKIQTSYLKSTTRRPTLVQAYIWRSMVSNVFGCFLWAAGCHWSIWNLYSFLYPGDIETGTSTDVEAVRKLALWRAVTSRLLLEKMGSKGQSKDTEVLDSFKTFLQLKIMKDLRVLLKGPVEECHDELGRLIDEAVNLDKLISQQASNISWDFGDESWSSFDPDTMSSTSGEKPQNNQEVLFTVAPAMMKQGRDTGDDFHIVSSLLAAEVSCVTKRKGLAFWR
ncbi:hypothetical protein F5X99DRAFT_117615 [Biscogniauxia marginata]|nr:hypothetical protein F5X99DRAFT_117615 [Biscogniauxia marginata]